MSSRRNDMGLVPVPRELDANAKIFIWDFDVAALFVFGFAIGIMVGSWELFWGFSSLKPGAKSVRDEPKVSGFIRFIGICPVNLFAAHQNRFGATSWDKKGLKNHERLRTHFF